MDKQFVNGLNIKTIETKYGEIIKIGIEKNEILNNPYNNRDWLNFDIKKGKSGNWYAEINSYRDNNTQTNNTTSKDVNVKFDDMNFDDEEIPF